MGRASHQAGALRSAPGGAGYAVSSKSRSSFGQQTQPPLRGPPAARTQMTRLRRGSYALRARWLPASRPQSVLLAGKNRLPQAGRLAPLAARPAAAKDGYARKITCRATALRGRSSAQALPGRPTEETGRLPCRPRAGNGLKKVRLYIAADASLRGASLYKIARGKDGATPMLITTCVTH